MKLNDKKVQHVRAKRSSSEGLTIRSSQLELEVKPGDRVVVDYASGISQAFNVTRKGDTLYASKKSVARALTLPKVGKPTFEYVKKVTVIRNGGNYVNS